MNIIATAANGAKVTINPSNVIEVQRHGNGCKLWVFVNGCNYAEFMADNFTKVQKAINLYKSQHGTINHHKTKDQ